MIDRRYAHPQALRGAPRAVLEEAIRTGVAPAFGSLRGWVFRGWNTMRVTRLIGIRKFAKGFYEGPPRGSGPEPFLQGYNMPVRQNADWDPHVLARPDRPKRFGFYRVYAAPSRYGGSLLLDYARGGNGLSVPRILRDYLVAPWPDEPDILLGKAYLALGVWIPAGYFVLSRWMESDYGQS